MVDSTGSVTDYYEYDAWGNVLPGSYGSTPFKWNAASGYQHVPLTGLYHGGAREYDPRTARWLQRDPIGIASGDPNLYRYCGNDAVNCIDPTGAARIEVRYKRVGAAFHAFLVVIDENGNEWYFRGGPSYGFGGSTASSQSSGGGSSHALRKRANVLSSPSDPLKERITWNSGSSNGSSNSTSPGAARGGPGKNNGVWGPIKCDWDVYDEESADWTTQSLPTQVVVDDDKPAKYYMDQLAHIGNSINSRQIPYSPLVTNSNTVIREALEQMALTPPRPKVWVPAWWNRLPSRM